MTLHEIIDTARLAWDAEDSCEEDADCAFARSVMESCTKLVCPACATHGRPTCADQYPGRWRHGRHPDAVACTAAGIWQVLAEGEAEEGEEVTT